MIDRMTLQQAITVCNHAGYDVTFSINMTIIISRNKRTVVIFDTFIELEDWARIVKNANELTKNVKG